MKTNKNKASALEILMLRKLGCDGPDSGQWWYYERTNCTFHQDNIPRHIRQLMKTVFHEWPPMDRPSGDCVTDRVRQRTRNILNECFAHLAFQVCSAQRKHGLFEYLAAYHRNEVLTASRPIGCGPSGIFFNHWCLKANDIIWLQSLYTSVNQAMVFCPLCQRTDFILVFPHTLQEECADNPT